MPMGAEKIYTLFKYKVLDFWADFCYTYGAAVSPAFAAGGTRGIGSCEGHRARGVRIATSLRGV